MILQFEREDKQMKTQNEYYSYIKNSISIKQICDKCGIQTNQVGNDIHVHVFTIMIPIRQCTFIRNQIVFIVLNVTKGEICLIL